MCTFGLSDCCVTPRRLWGLRGFTRQPEKSKRAHFREEKKKREILGLPPFGAAPSGAAPFVGLGSHPSAPQTSGPPLFLGFGPPPFGAPPKKDWCGRGGERGEVLGRRVKGGLRGGFEGASKGGEGGGGLPRGLRRELRRGRGGALKGGFEGGFEGASKGRGLRRGGGFEGGGGFNREGLQRGRLQRGRGFKLGVFKGEGFKGEASPDCDHIFVSRLRKSSPCVAHNFVEIWRMCDQSSSLPSVPDCPEFSGFPDATGSPVLADSSG